MIYEGRLITFIATRVRLSNKPSHIDSIDSCLATAAVASTSAERLKELPLLHNAIYIVCRAWIRSHSWCKSRITPSLWVHRISRVYLPRHAGVPATLAHSTERYTNGCSCLLMHPFVTIRKFLCDLPNHASPKAQIKRNSSCVCESKFSSLLCCIIILNYLR